MLKKKDFNKFSVLLLSLLFFSLFFKYVQASNVRSQGFNVYFPVDSSLGFQNGAEYVLLNVTSGNLNSSNAYVFLNTGGGAFRFLANETLTLLITFNVTNVKVSGDYGNDFRVIQTGVSIPININDNIDIVWESAFEIWFPIQFIFGIVGLISMFGGSLLGVSLLKKGEYSDALRFSAIWVALGITLTIAWLWA